MAPSSGWANYRLSVTINAEASAGSINNIIYLETNDPAGQFVPVTVTANIRPELEVENDRK